MHVDMVIYAQCLCPILFNLAYYSIYIECLQVFSLDISLFKKAACIIKQNALPPGQKPVYLYYYLILGFLQEQ